MEKVVSLLQDEARSLARYGMKKHLRILPMYSGLPYAEQMKVFERAPSSVRKVSVLCVQRVKGLESRNGTDVNPPSPLSPAPRWWWPPT